jgi:hypothetical protein
MAHSFVPMMPGGSKQMIQKVKTRISVRCISFLQIELNEQDT